MKKLLIFLLLLGLPCYAVTEYTIGNMENIEPQELIKILDEHKIKTQKDFEIYYTNMLNYIETNNTSTWGEIFLVQQNMQTMILKGSLQGKIMTHLQLRLIKDTLCEAV